MRKSPPRVAIKIEKDGKTYSGSYTVELGVVTVVAAFGTKSTQVGGSPPESIAKIILRELIDKAKASGLIK